MRFMIFMATRIGCLMISLIFLAGCSRQPEVEVPVVKQAETTASELGEGIEEELPDEESEMMVEPEPKKEEPEPEPQAEAPVVKGIYITGPMAGHEKMAEREQLAADTELNAMVIDIKNDGDLPDGRTYGGETGSSHGVYSGSAGAYSTLKRGAESLSNCPDRSL